MNQTLSTGGQHLQEAFGPGFVQLGRGTLKSPHVEGCAIQLAGQVSER